MKLATHPDIYHIGCTAEYQIAPVGGIPTHVWAVDLLTGYWEHLKQQDMKLTGQRSLESLALRLNSAINSPTGRPFASMG